MNKQIVLYKKQYNNACMCVTYYIKKEYTLISSAYVNTEGKKRYQEKNKEYIHRRKKQYYKKNKAYVCQQCKLWRIKNSNYIVRRNQSIEHKYSSYKYVANRRKLFFNLTYDNFALLVSSPCYYCGKLQEYCNGIDRVDNSKGYTIRNSVSCCKYCNRMKSDMLYSNFITMCYNVIEKDKIRKSP